MSKKIAGYIREIPSGDPELGIEVRVRDEYTNVLVPSGGMQMCTTNPMNTDAVTGYFEWTCELSPGPVKIEATSGSGQVKKRSGLEMMQTGDVFYSDVPDMLRIFTNGPFNDVLNEFLTTASGLNLTVRTGMAQVQGRLFSTATNRVISQGANVTLATRNDLLCLRQWVGGTHIGKQEIALVVGTVNAVDPTLNTDPNIAEVPIYRAALANGGSTPVLTDLRVWATVTVGALLIDHNTLVNINADASPTAIHHTLGTGANQSAAGNHNHNAAYSVLGHTHAYAATVHTHAEADVTSLVADLAGKAPTIHTHSQSQITNLLADLVTISNEIDTKADIAHTHVGEATRFDVVNKSHVRSSISVGSDNNLASNTIFLENGINYDILVVAVAQGGIAVGASTAAQLGVKYGADATVWGSKSDKEDGESAMMASTVVQNVAGDNASHTYYMRGTSTGPTGTAYFTGGQVYAIAIPRTTS